MSKKPNLFIIGAPKCGTTSLCEYLRSHPDVFFSNPKEPHYFNKDNPKSEKITEDEYLEKYFSGVANQKVIAEGSTWYLFSKVAVSNILAFNPDAKFIVMLRNPIEMAESLYYEERSHLTENASSFKDAWQRHKDDECCVPYGAVCKLGEQVERLLSDVADKSKVMLVDFGEFVNDADTVYGEVLDFLGIAHDGRSQFVNAHPRKKVRYVWLEHFLRAANNSKLREASFVVKKHIGIKHWPYVGAIHRALRKANLMPAQHAPLDAAFNAELYDYFKEDVALLDSLTGIDLFRKIDKDFAHPNFFIIGAPKCGTTALSEYLRSHPDIYFSTPKEPNYFNADIPSKKLYHYASLEDYLSKCFRGAKGYKAVGEGSVRYLYSDVAVPTILKIYPDAKFIVMLRNPVDLGFSLFYQHVKNLNEDAATYEEAWNLQEQRKRGEHVPEHCAHPSLLQYDKRCRLGDQLEKLFNYVQNREQILIIPFNDLKRDAKSVYEKVLSFLGVPNDSRKEFPVVNEYASVKYPLLEQVLDVKNFIFVSHFSKKVKRMLGITNWPLFVWLNKLNYKKLPKETISNEFRQKLTEHFRSDVEKVKRLTGIDLYEK